MSVDAPPQHEESLNTPRFDSTEVMTPIDDVTEVIPAVSDAPQKFFVPIVAIRPLLPVAEEDELVIYDCGTASPGQIHDPCQHSTVQVLCCTCAGCMFDLWSCGAKPAHDGWLWWEAEQIGARWDPWVRHPYAMVLYALLIIFGLASNLFADILYIFAVVGALIIAVFLYGLQAAFT